MLAIRIRLKGQALAPLALICMFFATIGVAQEPPEKLTAEALRAHLKVQLDLLDSPEFRTRELASWRLRQYPAAAIDLIESAAPDASINSASQQVVILDLFLSHSDTAIKTAAYDTLKRFSLTKTTALASLAASSVKGIEDEFERQAYEILTHAGANVGYLDINNYGTAGKAYTKEDLIGVEIKDGVYTGSREALTWIRHLKSARIVSLEGEFASPEILALVAQMPEVKKILLRGKYIRPGVYETKLKPADLLILNQLEEIKHFEIRYMSIDDSFVSAICQLPITETLRLFGTAITERGKNEIAQKLDDVSIYRGNGGFLGIGSQVLRPVVVNTVQPNSAAQKAGIREGDTITEIQGESIRDFAGLRETIAKYSPNEMLLIKLQRPKENGQPGFFEQQYFVVLNEQQN